MSSLRHSRLHRRVSRSDGREGNVRSSLQRRPENCIRQDIGHQRFAWSHRALLSPTSGAVRRCVRHALGGSADFYRDAAEICFRLGANGIPAARSGRRCQDRKACCDSGIGAGRSRCRISFAALRAYSDDLRGTWRSSVELRGTAFRIITCRRM